jgi:hypothetical protein
LGNNGKKNGEGTRKKKLLKKNWRVQHTLFNAHNPSVTANGSARGTRGRALPTDLYGTITVAAILRADISIVTSEKVRK